MYNVRDFVKWALTHVKPETVPQLATLALPWNECGTEPWQYLFGSVKVQTTQATLDYYYNNHYKDSMTRARYDTLTADWDRNGYATDCQGLLDAWLTYECGVPTDINADMNYRNWCTEKGAIADVDRPFVVGEAVFRSNGTRMTHIGWVCGFMQSGDPLIVEARGIAYGVVITRLSQRDFTHRGLMTVKFNYNDNSNTEDPIMPEIDFNTIKPMQSGEAYLAMQKALNLAGFTDAEGKALEEDGKWGKRSREAFYAMIAEYADDVVVPSEPATPVPSEPATAEAEPKIMFPFYGYTVCVFDSDDLPFGNEV